MVMVAAVGIGSIAAWMNWKMRSVLIAVHKENLSYLADRLPRDVEHFSGTRSAETGLQPAIDHLMYEDVLVWVTGADGRILAESMTMSGRADDMALTLTNLSKRETPLTNIHEVDGRYFIFCQKTLMAKGTDLGWMHIAKDVTAERLLLDHLTRHLILASTLVLCLLTLATALWIRSSLQPLWEIGQLTKAIAVEDLGQARLQLDSAPAEVRELSETLEQMLLRLSQAWEQQQQFVSNISHELRTPLTIVDGYLNSILRRSNNSSSKGLTELQREGLEVAASETARTIRLLQDLLDLARADSGHIRFYPEKLVLDDLVEEVARMACSCKDRQIEVERGPEPIWMLVDRDRLKQVLLNLIHNAIKYSEPDQPIKLCLSHRDKFAEIQIIDQGQGIALQHQTRIFERFYRVDEARSRDTGGAGLGLSIVKTLIEMMGGRIEVYSQPGEGSTFTVLLPALEKDQ
jgi:signal transduction histidine kinase